MSTVVGPSRTRWPGTLQTRALAVVAAAAAAVGLGLVDWSRPTAPPDVTAAPADALPGLHPGGVASRVTTKGVRVELAVAPATPGGSLTAGETAVFRLTVTDATSGQPVAARPAAWVATKPPGPADPTELGRRAAAFASGVPTARAAIDLNAFQVATMNGDATLTVLDPLSGLGGSKMLALVALPSAADDWAIDAGHRRLFVACGDGARVAEVDATTWTVTRLADSVGPVRRLALQPDGQFLWAAAPAADGRPATVTSVATDTLRAAAAVPVGDGPHDIAFDRDSRFAFVACRAAGVVEVLAADSGAKVAVFRTGPAPVGVAYSAAADAVYVSDAETGGLTVLDARTPAVRARVPTPPGLGKVRFTPGGRWGFVPVPATGKVLVIDAAAGRVAQTVDVDKWPDQVTFSDRFAYVRHRDSATVVLIPLDRVGLGERAQVFEVLGGRAAFGAAGAPTPAAGIVQAAGEGASLMANPADKTVYYYAEGMAAPKGGFSTYGRTPRAVLAVERNLRERAPGVFETAARLPAGGAYEVLVRLDNPLLLHAFDLSIAAPPVPPTPPPPDVVMTTDGPATAGKELTLRFALTRGPERAAVTGAADLVVQAYCPGTWQSRRSAAETAPGVYTVTFTLPRPGLYHFHLDSQAAGLSLADPLQLVLSVTGAGT